MSSAKCRSSRSARHVLITMEICTSHTQYSLEMLNISFTEICANIIYILIQFRNKLPIWLFTLRWRHNGCDGVSNHQPRNCLLNRLFRRRSTKPSKLRVTGLCVRNSPGTGEFPAQMASNAENVSIWWRHHEKTITSIPVGSNSWSIIYVTHLTGAGRKLELVRREHFIEFTILNGMLVDLKYGDVSHRSWRRNHLSLRQKTVWSNLGIDTKRCKTMHRR